MKPYCHLAIGVILLGVWCNAAFAADCTVPPSNAMPLSTTFDDYYLGWCNDSTLQILLSGLHIESDDWTDGFGIEEQGSGYVVACDPNTFLARLLNAAFIVREVEKHAVPFGEHRQVTQVSGFPFAPLASMGSWWLFASGVEIDEWEPSCETDSNASNHPGFPDEYIALKLKGAYQMTAMQRSAVIVHEATHADIGHIPDGLCTNKKSCDVQYGQYNASTMHINYLYDAAGTYVTKLHNGQLVRPVQMLNNECRYIPRFSFDEREAARDKAQDDMIERFAFAPPVGTKRYDSVDAIDVARGGVFACKQCSVASWDFAPNLCKQTACNEILNAANSGKNLLNKVACSVYNATVSDEFVTPDHIAAAKADFDAALWPCAPADAAGARPYCEAQKSTATHVSQIDACGWLDNVYLPSINKLMCVQEFCRDKFTASGGWNASEDPFGCLDYLCEAGGGFCGDADNPQQCKEQFVMAHGDPEFYMTQCEADQCKDDLVDCLEDLHAQTPPAWAYGDPIPEQCSDKHRLCVLAAQLAVTIWAEFEPFVGPGPVEQGIGQVSNSPAVSLHRYLQAFRDAVARGTSERELGKMAVKLTAAPEMIAALYNAAPQEFVGMFGQAGFEETLGPGIQRVVGRPITPERLTPDGRAALAQLRQLVAGHPPGTVKCAIGTLQVHYH